MWVIIDYMCAIGVLLDLSVGNLWRKLRHKPLRQYRTLWKQIARGAGTSSRLPYFLLGTITVVVAFFIFYIVDFYSNRNLSDF